MYKYLYILIVSLFLFFGASSADAATIIRAPTNLGLVGYWSFNEGIGSTTTDFSGNGNHGTLANFPLGGSWVNGKRGKALNFDGSDDYVNMGSAAALDNLGPLTVSTWIYPRSHGENSRGRIVNKDVSGEGLFLFLTNTGGNEDIAVFIDHSTTDLQRRIGSGSLSHNTWHHVVFTWDGSTDATQAKIYVDGREPSSYTTTINGAGTRVSDSSANFLIGELTAGTRAFDGLIDEYRVYNRVLTAAEITTIYKSGYWRDAVNNTGLLAYWSFDDGSGSRLTDFSGSGHHGTLTDMDLSTTWSSGKFGRSLDFDGSDDIVTTASSTAKLDNMSAITVTAWIFPDDMGENASGRIVDKANAANPTSGWLFGLDGPNSRTGRVAFEVAYGTTNLSRMSANDSILTRSASWRHVAVTWDGSSTAANATIYIDGNAVDSYNTTTNGAGSRISDSNNDIEIGSERVSPNTRSFDGRIDEVRIYNRVLRSDEIRNIYESGATRVNASQNNKIRDGLISHWSFNGPDMRLTSVYDVSGQGNTGTITNNASPAQGKVGQGLNFDGATTFVSMASNSSGGDSFQGLAQATISAWVFPRSPGNLGERQIIYDERNDGDCGRTLFELMIGPSAQVLLKFDGGGTGNTIEGSANSSVTSTQKLATSTWAHVVGIFDSSSDIHKIYVNGVVTSASVATTSLGSGTALTQIIGNYHTSITQCSERVFDGILDEVRLYNRVLTDDEVRRLYNMGR